MHVTLSNMSLPDEPPNASNCNQYKSEPSEQRYPTLSTTRPAVCCSATKPTQALVYFSRGCQRKNLCPLCPQYSRHTAILINRCSQKHAFWMSWCMDLYWASMYEPQCTLKIKKQVIRSSFHAEITTKAPGFLTTDMLSSLANHSKKCLPYQC